MKPLFNSLPAVFLLTLSSCKSTDSRDESDTSDKPTIDATATAAATAMAAQPPASASVPAARGAPGEMFTTPSGLQYRIVASGPAGGRSPTLMDTVSVHYRGMLTDRTVFDSSIDRGQPASFGVSQVIPGWTEALQLMKPGDQWVLYIPARLAYGSRAVGDKIPPNSDLVFQVALLQVF